MPDTRMPDATRAAGTSDAAGERASGYGWRGRLGMLVPSVNTCAEPDAVATVPEGVTVHSARLRLRGSTREEFLAMTEDVEHAASLLADADPDLIVFHCTAVSTLDPTMGERLRHRIEGATGRPATTTSDALLAAFGALGAKRVVLLSPYIAPVNRSEVEYLAHYGIEVLAERGLDIATGAEMAAVPPERWLEEARALRHAEADAYFVSCTNIRVRPVVDAIERELGRPVVTSNGAMLWHCLRHMGVADRLTGFGTLLSRH